MEFSNFSEWQNYLATHFLEAMQEAAQAIASQFQMSVSNNIPFDVGSLEGSLNVQINGIGGNVTITLTWSTPYAQRQYWEHSVKGEWDIKTWEQNKGLFMEILNTTIAQKLGG